ncbi:phosphoglycerate dehydrogenase [Agrococcus baldri]|uniref:2-hydroxyacid dehydrogenase n=1 Tax=Agrococcus baldri TaxID=153730 RepID=A0AA87UR25_9MICO|nr:phosphoglycerate dehydrogenase [Agrococcus baldri]GEK79079.1 2-hydroxyacid dehydrogenase [Agrococcus baldri]
MPQRVLITSQFLRPDDEIDRRVRDAGHETRHAPLVGARPAAELIGLLEGVHGVIAGSDPFTAEVLRAAPELRVIARTGVGFDAIDVAVATELGIAVCNAPGVNRQSVAEHTFALMLAHARRLGAVLASTRAGRWERPAGTELAGETLGVVGLGAIGAAVARIGDAFGMRVVAHDPFVDAARASELGVELLPLEALAEQARYISLHLALTDATRGIVDAELLARMRPDAVVINTARGPIIDQAALVDALQAGTIGGAALDVVEHEPLAQDHPLRTLDSVILTPHIGGSTAQARARSARVAAASVLEALRGETPATLVNTSGHLGRRGR